MIILPVHSYIYQRDRQWNLPINQLLFHTHTEREKIIDQFICADWSFDTNLTAVFIYCCSELKKKFFQSEKNFYLLI